MEPFDPLTEIINSGQAFSFSITLERILWLMMGFFFIGALFTSITKGKKQHNRLANNYFLSFLKTSKEHDKPSEQNK